MRATETILFTFSVDIVVKKYGITDEQPCGPANRQFSSLKINYLNSSS